MTDELEVLQLFDGLLGEADEYGILLDELVVPCCQPQHCFQGHCEAGDEDVFSS